jgi:hypothetical protein
MVARRPAKICRLNSDCCKAHSIGYACDIRPAFLGSVQLKNKIFVMCQPCCIFEWTSLQRSSFAHSY